LIELATKVKRDLAVLIAVTSGQQDDVLVSKEVWKKMQELIQKAKSELKTLDTSLSDQRRLATIVADQTRNLVACYAANSRSRLDRSANCKNKQDFRYAAQLKRGQLRDLETMQALTVRLDQALKSVADGQPATSEYLKQRRRAQFSFNQPQILRSQNDKRPPSAAELCMLPTQGESEYNRAFSAIQNSKQQALSLGYTPLLQDAIRLDEKNLLRLKEIYDEAFANVDFSAENLTGALTKWRESCSNLVTFAQTQFNSAMLISDHATSVGSGSQRSLGSASSNTFSTGSDSLDLETPASSNGSRSRPSTPPSSSRSSTMSMPGSRR
jgi:hypothetical protein